MTIAALIVAAGRGTRAGGPIAKQWQEIAGRRCADWALKAFLEHPAINHTAVALHPDDIDRPLPGGNAVIRARGGATRGASVLAGLRKLAPLSPDAVLIHDVARPAVPRSVIDRVLEALEVHPGAAPGVAVTDALWTSQGSAIEGTHPRGGLFRAQTPQGFDFQAILKAHEASDGTAADDVEVARAAGLAVRLVDGHPDNLKITTPEDFERAARILSARMEE